MSGLPIGSRSRVARVVEEDGDLLVADARRRAEAAAPLLDDDAALLVDLVGIERQAAGEIGERREPFATISGLSVGSSSM